MQKGRGLEEEVRVLGLRTGDKVPTTLRIGPYRFFYSYDCGEPRHTHVDRENMSAKSWLDPDVSLAENYGFNRSELRSVERIIRVNLETLRYEWDAFYQPDTRAR